MLTIPELATQRVENVLSQTDEEKARTIVLAGSKGVVSVSFTVPFRLNFGK